MPSPLKNNDNPSRKLIKGVAETVQIIPLGGMGEVGKNMTAIRYGDEMIVIDAGVKFPEEEMLGIDLVIPDITYLKENQEKIKALILTHGHEDHIGGLPYVLRQINVPVYGTRLTLGLVENRLKEHNLSSTAKLHVIHPRQKVKMGSFHIEFFKMNHSIPDAVGLAVHTPVGTVVHTGDFKIDQTPVDGQTVDFYTLAKLGENGVLVMMSDSTNAERPGYTMSERTVGLTIDEIFMQAKQRIILATFASNIHRIQQVFDAAGRYGRKVAVVGRSMVNVVNTAMELGYLNVPEGCYVDIDEISRYPMEKVALITTGSQGEPMSALTRMAMSDHRKVGIVPGDTVVIAASAIPGNERLIGRTIDHLFKQGAEVIYESISGVHVSGHASQEELKLMLNLLKPKFFIPVHGEYRMLIQHAELAEAVGIPKENIFIAEIGDVLEFSREKGQVTGRVTAGAVLVDGLGVGDVGNIVLRDRRQLSQDGILIVVVTIERQNGNVIAGPDIITRGFIYVRESEELIEEIKEKVKQALAKCQENNITEWGTIKNNVRDVMGKYLFEKTRRRPMILPIIMEV